MKKRLIYVLLFMIFLLTAGVRLYYVLQEPNFSEDSAYFVLRQVQEIRDTGSPVYRDSLSYGGRTYIFLPLFHYILAFFSSIFDSVLVVKIIPNILAATLVFAIFLIVRHLTKDEDIALVSGFVSGFIPIFISETINSASVLSVSIPASFFLMYFLLRLRAKKSIHLYLIILSLLMITSTYALLMVFAMVLYIIFSWVEGFKLTRSEVELTLFSLFLAVWFYMLFYRDALLMHGSSIIWQNIPFEVFEQFYMDVNILETIYLVGLIPLTTGIFILYYYLFRKKKKAMYLILSLVLIITTLLLKKYLVLSIGLSFIGVIATILLGEFLAIVKSYLEKTKLAKFRVHIMITLFMIIILSSFIPSMSAAKDEIANSDSKDKVFALKLLANITSGDAPVAGSVFDGHLISYYSGKKNIIDSNFLLIDAKVRLRDIRTIYTSAIESKAVEIMSKYDAEFLIVTEEAKKYYNITRVSYVDGDCFPLIYSGKDVRIYENKC